MNSGSKILFPALIVLIIASCRPDSEFPDQPYLDYRSAEFVEDSDTSSNRRHIVYKVYFTDGDGDLGSDQPADPEMKPCDLSNNNLFIKYFEKTGGSYIEVDPIDPCLPFHNQIPVLHNGGSNPTLEGFINGQFDYNGFPFNPGVDSIKLEFQVVDQAGNYSNIAYSGAIAVPQP